MARIGFVPSLAVLLLALAFASTARGGDPNLIPTSERSTFTDGTSPAPLRIAPRTAMPFAIGPAGQIGTVPLPGWQSETNLAASGSQIVVGYNSVTPTGSGVGIMYSIDGGATFLDGGIPPLPAGYFSNGDPAVAVWNPPSGPPVFYCTTLALDSSNPAHHFIELFRSTTGGASWSGPFEVTSASVGTETPDREAITADPETGRVLIAWTHFGAAVTIRVSYSDNAANATPPTWSPAAIVGARSQDGQATTIVADPDNDNVYLAWLTFWAPAGGDRGIAFVKSANNGTAWPVPTDIGPLFWHYLAPYGFDRFLWSFSGSSLALNPLDHGLEMVYSASVDGTPAHDFGDVYYRRSTDGGANWSPAVPLNVFPGTDRPQANPCVSVTQDGRIDVFWYDESAGSGLSDLTDVFYTYSTDLGATWSSPVPVTATPFHNESGNNFGAPHQGDYNDAFSDPQSAGPGYGAFAVMAEPSPFTTGPDGLVFTAMGVQVAPLRVRPGSVIVADRGCDANDGVLVAGEAADLTIPLQNIGRTLLSGISATLTALTPGVDVQPGARAYPPLASGASGISGDVYRIGLSNTYPCGTLARFRLDISASGVFPTFVEFSLPTGRVESSVSLLSENFDGVVPPALPAGWSTVNLAATPNNWFTTTSSPASPPNAAAAADPAVNTFGRLQGPHLVVPAGAAYLEITFDTRFNIVQYDARYGADGFSLEYLLDGAGGSHFASGDASEFVNRYTHNIRRGSGNGSGDRSGWSGASFSYKKIRVRIPGLGGHSFQPYFDLATFGAVGGGGVWVDNVQVDALFVGCGSCNPTPALVAHFEARVAGEGVDLAWGSDAVGRISAWNLYRGASLEGFFERVNPDPIPMGAGGEFRLHDSPAVGGRIFYRLAAVATDGGEFVLETIPIELTNEARVFGLQLAGSNPFRGETMLRYSVAERGLVRIEVFDVAGRSVRTLVDRVSDPGTYIVAFERNGRGPALSPGIYLVRFSAGAMSRSLRLVTFD